MIKKCFGCGQLEEATDYVQDGMYNNINNNNNHGKIIDYDKNYNKQDDKNEIDLSSYNISEDRIISPLKCLFLSITNRVGKTSIIKNLNKEEFVDDYKETSFIETFKVPFTEKSNNREMEIIFWDCAGNEISKKLAATTAYSGDVDAIVFVYEITNLFSFNNLKEYIKQIKEKATKRCQFFLLGNKFDMASEEKRDVTIDVAQELAVNNDLIFLGECSAKNNTYIPDKELLYCKNKNCLEEYGKCKDGLKHMLNNILLRVYMSEEA